MNETLQRRLVGLAVLLSAAFLLSLLLPMLGRDDAPVSSVTVALGSEPVTEADAVPPPEPLPPEPEPVSAADNGAWALPDEVDTDLAADPAPASRSETPAASPAVGATLQLSPAVQAVASPSPSPSQTRNAPAAPSDTRPPQPTPPAHRAPVHPTPKLSESVAVAPPADAAAGWYVQVGSYSKPGSAHTIVTLLARIGVATRITRINGQKGQPLDRVRAGPFDSEAKARTVQQKIAKGGYPQSRIVHEPSR